MREDAINMITSLSLDVTFSLGMDIYMYKWRGWNRGFHAAAEKGVNTNHLLCQGQV